jgi:hypothetical protein
MKLKNNWRNKSIETLEERSYGDPATAPTYLVKQCLTYVKLPVGNLNTEQLRMLIGQQIGLTYLIPLALDVLDKDILAEGDFYPGDLLKNVVAVDVAFWKTNTELYNQVKKLIKTGTQKIRQNGLNTEAFPNL